MTGIEIVGTLLTHNPKIYLASAAIDSALYGIIFLASMFLPRPLIQVFAEAANGEIGSPEFRQTQFCHSAWQILTVLWGIVSLLKASLLIIVQVRFSLETFLLIRTMMGLPVFVALIMFSYWFPGWYWNRPQAVRH